jgi:hypothetical protein
MAGARSACGIIRPAPLASGQAVRRLTLDQEIEGSNPSSPANPQDTGLNVRLDYYILWFERVQASVAKEAIRCNGHLTPLIFGHLILDARINGHLILSST